MSKRFHCEKQSRGVSPPHDDQTFLRRKVWIKRRGSPAVWPAIAQSATAGALHRPDECRPDKNSGLKPLRQFVRLFGIHPSGSGGDGTGSRPLAGKAQRVPKAE